VTIKRNRTYWYIAVSSVALLIVFFIQIKWIFRAASIKEELFNEKAKIVLAKTVEALSSDKDACGSVNAGMEKKATDKIDSLFDYYMKVYNIKIDYVYELKHGFLLASNNIETATSLLPTQQRCYKQNVSGLDNMELRLIFPDKVQYIVAEMGTSFISSVLLIFIVLFLSWQTIFSLLKEKRLAEQTTDFITNMTHELKTPLTNIGLAGKMLLRENTIVQTEKVRHYSTIILDENEKLGRQVDEVLGMSALERGEMPLRFETTNLHTIIEEAIRSFSLATESQQAKLMSDLAASNPMVSGDRTHLKHVVGNLLDNAIKYAQGTPDILIRTYNKDDQIFLSVQDHGLGIEKKFHKKIFEKFFRVPTGDRHDVKGFGLGLCYVKKITELHNASIEVDSEKNKGTTFIIGFANV